MQDIVSGRHRVPITGDLGQFPPFYGWRVDYVGWLVARNYRRWVGMIIAGFVLLESLRLQLAWWIPGLFLCSYGAYAALRRHLTLRARGTPVSNLFLGLRGYGALVFVTALLSIVYGQPGGEETRFWLLYIPVLFILSRLQSFRPRGFVFTALMFVLTGLLIVLIPSLHGVDLVSWQGFHELSFRIGLVWTVGVLLHYLMRNVLKRAAMFDEDRDFASQIAAAGEHAADLRTLYETALSICMKRLRGAHGSIWLYHPSSGQLRLALGLRYVRETREDWPAWKWKAAEWIDWTEQCTERIIPYRQKDPAERNIIQQVAFTKKRESGTITGPYGESEDSAENRSPFRDNFHPVLVHQIAAPIMDRGGSGQVMAVVNVNYPPGLLDKLARTRLPFVRLVRRVAREYVVDWQSRLLGLTCQQLSPAWEFSHFVYLFDNYLGNPAEAFKKIEDAESARELVELVSDTLNTPVLTWYLPDDTGRTLVPYVYCTGTGSKSTGFFQGSSLSIGQGEIGRALEKEEPGVVPLAPGLARDCSFLQGHQYLYILPLVAHQGCVAACGIAMIEQDDLSPMERLVLKAFASQIGYAIGNVVAYAKVERQNVELERRSKMLHIVQQTGTAAISSRDFRELSRTVTGLIESELDEKSVQIGITEYGHQIVFPLDLEKDYADVILDAKPEADPRSAILHAWHTRRPVLVQDTLTQNFTLAPYWPEARSALLIPLKAGLAGEEGDFGMLIAHSPRPEAFSVDEMEFLHRLAPHLGVAVHNLQDIRRSRIMSRHQDVLLEVIGGMVETPRDERESFFQAIVRIVRDRAGGVHRAALYEYDLAEQSLVPRAQSPDHPHEAGDLDMVQVGAELAQHVLEHGTYWNPDLRSSDGVLAQGEQELCRSVIGVPIAVHDDKFGVLLACSDLPDGFSEDTVPILEAIAKQAAVVWRRLRSLQESAADEERERMLRDLHDNVQQIFPALGLEWGTLRHLAEGLLPDPKAEKLIARIDKLEATSWAAATAISVTVKAQYYPTLERKGLKQAIQEYLDAMRVLFFTANLSWHVDEGCEPTSPEERQHWFLITQGAISNAIRHSGAKNIDLNMSVDADANLILRIEDDGRGFDSAKKEIKPRSGLANMQWRARQLGAELEMHAVPGQGVVLQVIKRPGGAA